MSKKCIKLLLRWKTLFAISVAYVLYNEILCHHWQEHKWTRPSITENCTKILLVADPQLIGETNDQHLYNTLAIFDSDNYLQRTFRRALHHTQPDLIIFLGDIFDEGSIATLEEYGRYLERFRRIFKQNPKIPRIIVPGDNDIGGENGEMVTQQKVSRFQEAFQTKPFYVIGGRTTVHTVNRMTREIPRQVPKETNNVSTQRNIAVSHFSLLFHQDDFSDRVLRLLHPHVIFSGHMHRSMFIKRSQTYAEFTKTTPLNVGEKDRYQVLEFDLSETIQRQSHLEILVPTCSYRMGERNMGYGYAVIDHGTENLFYTVLWSVDRFQQLFVYIFLLSFWAVVGLIWLTVYNFRRFKRRHKKNPFYNKV